MRNSITLPGELLLLVLRLDGQLGIGAAFVTTKVNCIFQQRSPFVVLYIHCEISFLIVFTKNLLEDVWVSNHNHQSARPRNSHIKPLRIGEEAQFVGCVHCQELVRASHLVICTNVNSELRKYSG